MLSSAPRRSGQLRRPATRTPIVCVVDSKADDYRGWNSLAQAHGLRLEVVASAEEALRFSLSRGVDLWVINTELPGLSGLDLCGMLKSRRAGATVYLVADEYSPDAERAAWAGQATLFGCKPGHTEWLNDWLSNLSHGPP